MGLDGILNVILNYVLIISLWDALLFQIQPPIQNTGIINMYNYWGGAKTYFRPPTFHIGGRRPSSPPPPLSTPLSHNILEIVYPSLKIMCYIESMTNSI